MLEKVNNEIDKAGKVPDAVFENMMKNAYVKSEVLRELANSSQEKDDDMAGTTSYSGGTFLARDTMTVVHSSGTVMVRADSKIKQSNKFTSHSGDSPPDITSGASIKESASQH